MWVSHSHKDTGQVTALHTVHGTSTLETSQLDICCTMQAVPSSTKHLTTKASLVDERPVLFFCPMSLVVVQQEIAQLV